MICVIVESPYSGDVETNSRYLRACLRDCIQRGESPYASHGLLTQPGVLDDGDADQRKAGIEAGFAWRSRADRTVVYIDLGLSSGMRRGIDHAESIGHPVEYRELGGMWGIARRVYDATGGAPYVRGADVRGRRC